MTEIATNCEWLWCISLISLRYRFLDEGVLEWLFEQHKEIECKGMCKCEKKSVCWLSCLCGCGRECLSESKCFCVCADMLASVGMEECVYVKVHVRVHVKERESERVSKKRLWSVWIDESKNLRMSVFYLKLQLFGEEQNRKKSKAAKFCENKKKQEKQKEQQQWD